MAKLPTAVDALPPADAPPPSAVLSEPAALAKSPIAVLNAPAALALTPVDEKRLAQNGFVVPERLAYRGEFPLAGSVKDR